MKRLAWFATIMLVGTAPVLMAQSTDSDHIEAGAFVDYFNLSRTSPHRNLVGLGGRAAFNVHRNVQVEAEMAYDFKRNFTSTFSNGLTTELVSTQVRTLHALFGPKFETGSGPFRAFATFKTGLINFSVSNQNATAGFKGALGSVTNGATNAAIYPGIGVEAFKGPFGARAEVGDEIYFDNGAHHNLRVTFGPQVRF